MKRLYLLFLLSVFTVLLGCSNQKAAISPMDYEEFKNKFLQFKAQFQPEDFSLISPESLTIITTSFPENHIDHRQADVIDGSSENPARYEIYYKSNETDLLVKVNFIYFPESKQNQFLTINSISPLEHGNIAEEYKDLSRPFIDEYLLAFDGYLVLINFIDTNISRNEKYSDEWIPATLSFYSQFEKALLKNN